LCPEKVVAIRYTSDWNLATGISRLESVKCFVYRLPERFDRRSGKGRELERLGMARNMFGRGRANMVYVFDCNLKTCLQVEALAPARNPVMRKCITQRVDGGLRA